MERSAETARLSRFVFLVAALLVGFFALSHFGGRPAAGLRADRETIDLGRVSARGAPATAEVVLTNTAAGELLVSGSSGSVPGLAGWFPVDGKEEVEGRRLLRKRAEARFLVIFDPRGNPSSRGEAVHLLHLHTSGNARPELTLRVRVVQTD